MAIYDCFQFFDEEHILDLRLNILNEFVDFFVMVESTTDHQGNSKKLNFDSKKFKEFNNKIIYIVVDDTAEAIKKPHIGGESLVEQHQRNSLTRGLKNCRDNDLIVNPAKGKQLTNMRAAGSDENVILTPPVKMSLEDCITYINEDELVEVTPKSIRLRKISIEKDRRNSNG